MQKKESAERKMSKIKTKKALTPEQKKKRIRNIIIVAVILVAASVATYWMQPQNKALAESEVFSEEEVKAQAEKIIGLLNAKPCCPGHAGDHEQRAHGRGEGTDLGRLGRFCFH